MHRSTRSLTRFLVLTILPLSGAAALAGALWAQSTRPATQPAASLPEPPSIFDELPIPEDNPMTPEKVELGRLLFFDKMLSGDGSRSCYSCHLNEKGLTDGRPTAVGSFNKKLTRSSPTLWNIGFQREFYWDGRAGSLEKQAMAAWKGGNMGADATKAVEKIKRSGRYKGRFQAVFGEPASPENVVKAIAAYERTIYCADTRYDRFQAGDGDALTEQERRGHELFKGKAACTNCHVGGLLTDTLYHNAGIGMDAPEPDIGRKKVTGDEKDTGAFKTPTLRDITRTAPYFHNGSVKSLREAVKIMASGGLDNPYLDRENLRDRQLTDAELEDLVAFLGSLECPGKLEKPGMP